jgi:hypothetical protein
MRVWKLEASADQERIACRWGFALAATAEDALALAKATSPLPFHWVHEKPTAMLWQGAPGARVECS